MQELKSFKKYSWLFSALFAILVFISGLTANDLTFLPAKYQSVAVGLIGASALIVKLVPENYRVSVAENIVKAEYDDKSVSPKEDIDYNSDEVDNGA